MNKTTKNLTALILIGASTLFSSGCGCRKENSPYVLNPTPAEKIDEQKVKTLDYIKQNPESQEQILNYIVLSRERNKLGYSRETIDNFYNVLRKKIEDNPRLMKDEIMDMTKIGLYSEYRGEIIASLPFREKMMITKECSFYKTKEIAENLKENITELDRKLEESNPEAVGKVKGIIRSGMKKTNVPEAVERVKRDANDFYENVKEKIYGNN